MPPKFRLPRIFLFLGFVLLAIVLVFLDALREYRSFQLKKIQTYQENFFAPGDPQIIQRLRPTTCVKKEVILATTFGEPFSGFSEEDWNNFWEIIYGLYPKVEPEKPGLPNKLRQLSDSEIIAELISRYPRPFEYYKKEHWEYFFTIIAER